MWLLETEGKRAGKHPYCTPWGIACQQAAHAPVGKDRTRERLPKIGKQAMLDQRVAAPGRGAAQEGESTAPGGGILPGGRLGKMSQTHAAGEARRVSRGPPLSAWLSGSTEASAYWRRMQEAALNCSFPLPRCRQPPGLLPRRRRARTGTKSRLPHGWTRRPSGRPPPGMARLAAGL